MHSIIEKNKLDSYLCNHKDLSLIYDYLQEENRRFVENGNEVLLPYYFSENYPDENIKQSINNESELKRINIEYKGKMRDEQVPIVNNVLKYYEDNNNLSGVLEASTGFGKTYISVYLITKLKYKTLIVLHNIRKSKNKKNILEDEEWYKTIIESTNLTQNDIGIFFGGKEELDKPIVICSVQTLLSKLKSDFTGLMKKLLPFGFVIYDEAHCMAGFEFSKARMCLNTENVLAVTATPPSDYSIKQILFNNTYGGKICTYKNYEDFPPEIYFVAFDSKLPNDLIRTFLNKPKGYRRYMYYSSIISKSNIYCDLIKKLTKNILTNTKRRIFVLVKTVDENNPKSQSVNFFSILDEFKPGKYYKDYTNYKEKCIIAGVNKFGVKISIPEGTDMLISFPIINKDGIEQIIGRILRKVDGKPQPRVWFLIDKGLTGYFIKNIHIIKDHCYDIYGKDVVIKILAEKFLSHIKVGI